MQKSIYKDPRLFVQIIYAVITLAQVGVSLYLTKHYYEYHFPTGLNPSGLCNINDYFNCDITSGSPLSSLFGAPISVFGLVLGIIMFVGLFLKEEAFEKTNYQLTVLNAIGCVLLGSYSAIALGGLCPYCTIYYILSFALLFWFWKFSSPCKEVSINILGVYALLVLIPAGAFGYYTNNKQARIKENSASLKKDLMKQYDNLPKLTNPTKESPYRLNWAHKNFADAPLRMVVFSDFQCPACKTLSNSLHILMKKFKNDLNIQYFFYPLDINCNPNMKNSFHEYACLASYISVCAPKEKFSKIHDEIFANQEKLSTELLNGLAKKYGVEECVKDPKTKEKVTAMIKQADQYDIKSTPTLLINEVKTEGVLPIDQFELFLQGLKEKGSNK